MTLGMKAHLGADAEERPALVHTGLEMAAEIADLARTAEVPRG